MKKILILGAGRSATTLINYLLDHAFECNWQLIVCDAQPQLAREKTKGHPRSTVLELNVMDSEACRNAILNCDIVISMLPPKLHIKIALECIQLKRDLINASYISPELKALENEVKSAGILFLCEMGLDPGIDHMSAMSLFDEIRAKGGKITDFKSYTGGLVAPQSDDNPWHYKFSWSPRNVVLAGQGTAKYLEDNAIRYVPYNRTFQQIKSIDIPGLSKYESYANRDSIAYQSIYQLDGIKTLYRGTIRHAGFCEAWNALVQLGWTDSNFIIEEDDIRTQLDITKCLTPPGTGHLEQRLSELLSLPIDSPAFLKLKWLGLFDAKPISRKKPTPADVLEDILLDKWKLKVDDKDMIIMQHEIGYTLDEQEHEVKSTLIEIGQNATDTAMSRLVGLPMAIFTKILLTEGCSLKGIHIPVSPEIYSPVLKELKKEGVVFKDLEYTT